MTETWKKARKWVAGFAVGVAAVATFISHAQQIAGMLGALFATATEKQVEVTPHYFKVMPASLVNTIGSQDYLYWFHFSGQNRTDRQVTLTLSLTTINAPIPKDSQETVLTLKGKEQIKQAVNPEIKLMHPEDPRPLQVNLRATVDKHEHSAKLVQIDLLPRNEIDWDLQPPEGQPPLPREFLLASLTAWIQSPDDSVRALAKQLFAGVDARQELPSLVRQWMERCHDLLLRDPGKLRLRPPEGGFPPGGRQTIHTPGEVLEAKSASPLEAALLVSAMTLVVRGRHEGRIGMVVLPDSGTSGELRDYHLIWRVAGLDDWEAFSVSRASSEVFRVNKAAATTRIRSLFSARPEVAKRVDGGGVYVERGVPAVAIDFGTAKRRFNVRGLP
jgi:hypothetical protein